jgi:8-oxo-dGTP pyrophosphatase MutT (NUDIX family)
MRETHEEIGIEASSIRPIGFLDRFDTISDYRVLPVVGLLEPGLSWTPDHTEVEEVFTVPLPSFPIQPAIDAPSGNTTA